MGEVVELISEEGMDVEERKENGKNEGENPPDIVTEEGTLPRFVLRVLLVEADDSTRQIIAALLRKCSYEVAAVPDGLKAWETLKERPQNIDLILTEVALPSISGYALLTLIMEHDICKNIPVIMMSTQSSISMVLKCMLKGAADFLIKPVRRNELKNLWQHVWRRRTHSVAHVMEDKDIAKCRVQATSADDVAGNNSSDDMVSTEKNEECCKKGRGSQDLTKLICLTASNLSHAEQRQVCTNIDEKSDLPENDIGGVSITSELGIASCDIAHNSVAFKFQEDHACTEEVLRDASVGPEIYKADSNINREVHRDTDELVEPSGRVIDLIGKFGDCSAGIDGHYSCNDETNKFGSAPQLELSLRRFRPCCLKNEGNDEKYTLNHSSASAFSRYDSRKTLQRTFSTFSSNPNSGNTCDTSPWHAAVLTNSGEISTTLFGSQSSLAEAAFPSPQLGIVPMAGSTFDGFVAGYGQMIALIVCSQSGFPTAPRSAGEQVVSPFPRSSSLNSSSGIHISEHVQCTLDGTTTDFVGQNLKEDSSLEFEVGRHGSPGPGLSSSGGLCNAGTSNPNPSSYGSICNSSDKDTTLVAIATESENDSRIISYVGSREMDSHCATPREAALMKFRLKRKERCYEKKVRYQSRKRLAEQRPRMKGQFVRQVQNTPLHSEIDGGP